MTALYVALEGPDGVGKSTVAAALQAQLLRERRYARVRIRHFPTDALAQCAKDEGRALKAEDYLLDMENWLRYRPEPVLFPDEPQRNADAQPDTLYVLDRWVLSTLVYANLRGEGFRGSAMTTVAWLQRIPLTTFVLVPKTPAALTDPDYGADNNADEAYDPEAVSGGYRKALASAFVSGCFSRYIPIVVDRGKDTPRTTAEHIAEWVDAMQNTAPRLDADPEPGICW